MTFSSYTPRWLITSHKFSKILVTGGAGFIGSHIVDRLQDEGFEVTVIDNLTTGCLKNIVHNEDKENFNFIKGDIRDLHLVKGIVKDVDAVFHEAALASVIDSFKNPLITHDINVTGTLNLLKACLDSGVKRFIFASSASVYGETKTLPLKENMTPLPISPYAVSKLVAENYARLFYKVYGIETLCLRYFNVYGPRETKKFGVIYNFINRILLHDQSPIIYGDGEQLRDFIYVRDIVDANMLALKCKNAVGDVFNIGSGKSISINQLAKILLRLCGKIDLKPIYKDSRPGETKYGSCADISKARKLLGYNPKITIEEGLIKLINWYSPLGEMSFESELSCEK